MNTDIHPACACYGLYDEETIIAFIGVIHQPHGKHAKLKRISRLVVLPDYQGIGIGYKFLEAVAEYYKKQGFEMSIVTSAKNLIMRLYHSDKWIMARLGVAYCSSRKSKIEMTRIGSMRPNCKTAGFHFRG